MSRSPDAIMAWRHTALIVVRILALVLLLVGVYHICFAFALLVITREPSFLEAMWEENWNWLACGVSFALPGCVFLVIDRRLVRWLIPMPRAECPQCGYSLASLTTARCPECGCEIPPTEHSAS